MDNLTSSPSINVTSSSGHASSGTLYYAIDVVLILIVMVGIIGNLIALYILSSSAKIRESKAYVLLMNQSLIDLLSSFLIIVNLAVKYRLPRHPMSSGWDSVMCHLFYNRLNTAMVMCCSTYNLVALSLDRMVSVVWPIGHRCKITRSNMVATSVLVWIFGITITTSFSVPVNGITPSGGCYYWNNYPSGGLFSKVFGVSFNVAQTILPMTAMTVAYAVIYARLVYGGARSRVRLNVVRMLATCVLAFVVCTFPRAFMSIYARLADRHDLISSHVFTFALIMLQCNSVVNPIIYSLQYQDYRKELNKQFRRLLGRPDDTTYVSEHSRSDTSMKTEQVAT